MDLPKAFLLFVIFIILLINETKKNHFPFEYCQLVSNYTRQAFTVWLTIGNWRMDPQ